MEIRIVSPLSIAFVAAAYITWRVFRIILRHYTSSLRYLRGPKSRSWLLGNLTDIYDNQDWVAQYGDTLKFTGILSSDALFTIDTKALNHILHNTACYRRPEIARSGISDFMGQAEGDRHRNQRRVMNPAFGPAQIREFTKIFLLKSMELARSWGLKCVDSGDPVCVDVVSGLSKMTLDVIGLAGFDYAFNSLDVHGKPNELNEAFDTVFRSGMAGASLFRLLKLFFPLLGYLPVSGTKEVRNAYRIMRKIGERLIGEKRETALHAKDWQGDRRQRDLLTLLIQGNTDPSIPDSERLTDEEILAQIPTFLVAGHETTSNVTAWALYSLSIEHHVQTRLREECLSIPTDYPTMDDLNDLPYLDSVVRETLRLHPPLNSTMREATKEDIIPLSKPYMDVHGRLHDYVQVDKGCMVQIPMLAVNRSKAIWGEDALEFRPERWSNVPAAAQKIPGTWSNMMTFLGGPRACIGYRFSLVEMKALIFTLIRAFEFELAVPKDDVVRQNASIQRPILRSALDKGSQLPMLIKQI
ncbi:cytochrome P450 [Fomitopsis betulina]|nr:cytochrome P450 [Fomitopsis betulina]